ncbi:MAG: hypothetical protein A2W34_03245 [Chloroflexi bacterium RBG_16_64_32]|nr:MAG: hypothetical protein A2W34_03245 [Chloroflexi bacterium RBG_16_64_32]
MHVIVDGFGGDPEQLSDENVVRAILDLYPDEMGMTKIAPATVVRYKGTKPEDWGVSGYVMIAESHISVHTFPERCLIWADIFSCKDFDAVPLVDDLRRRFGLREMQVNILERGLEAPAASGQAPQPTAALGGAA